MPAKLSSSLNQSTPSADHTVSFFTLFTIFTFSPIFHIFVLHTFHCSCSIDGSKYTPNLTWSHPHCPHLTPHTHRGTLSLNLHTPQKVCTTRKEKKIRNFLKKHFSSGVRPRPLSAPPRPITLTLPTISSLRPFLRPRRSGNLMPLWLAVGSAAMPTLGW